MRRPPPAGVIRPRAVVSAVSAKPLVSEVYPPPSSSGESSSAGRRNRLLLLLLCCVFGYGIITNFFLNQEDEGVDGSSSFVSRQLDDSTSNLRSNSFQDEDEPEEKPSSKSKAKSKPVAKTDDDEEEESPEEEEDGETPQAEEEEEEEDDENNDGENDSSAANEADEEEVEEDSTPVKKAEPKQPIKSAGKPLKPLGDVSRSVQSYFSNFGGNVVDIDKEGSFKYVLIRMEDSMGGNALLVRSCLHSEGTHCKHHHAFARAKAELELRGFVAKVIGGGRITRHPSRHVAVKAGYLSVFGYSKTYGTCEDCNKIACTLIKAAFPDHGVKWANEGYLESDERKIATDAWTRCE